MRYKIVRIRIQENIIIHAIGLSQFIVSAERVLLLIFVTELEGHVGNRE
jgi:hypothetical protein